MSVVMKVPTVGESITEVTVANWAKNDGDHVQMDEVLCELESDKATFEVTAEKSGILRIKAQAGDTVPIGGVLCEIEEAAGGAKPATAAKAPAAAPASAPTKTGQVIEMTVPTVGESITEVTLGTWQKNDGDFVNLDEIIAEIESDKATFDLAAQSSGILRHVAKQGDTLPIGGLICKIEVATGAPPAAPSAIAAPAAVSAPAGGGSGYAAGHPSPAAGKILDEKGINPADVQGSGRDGRITKEDALAAQKSAPAPAAKGASPEPQAPVLGTGISRNQRREKMSALRKTVSRRLVAVKNETAMLTTFNEVNMKPIMDLRKKFKDEFKEKHGVGLGFMSFFTKACCVALQEWPAVNAMIDENEIVFNDYCDVSIAVSAPKGLVVPVIRNAESMSLAQIEAEVMRLAGRARDNKLSIEEMQGGTFTITNGGVFGSMMSTPIINAPQSAILGMHNIIERPVVENGEIVVRPMMYVALSYDHRIIDGRESVSFLVRVKQLLEDPTRLLLGV
jgi:2-oxoglutarate dehydrogenase E2 component (dihydrolipoamide succinyltransferase)